MTQSPPKKKNTLIYVYNVFQKYNCGCEGGISHELLNQIFSVHIIKLKSMLRHWFTGFKEPSISKAKLRKIVQKQKAKAKAIYVHIKRTC